MTKRLLGMTVLIVALTLIAPVAWPTAAQEGKVAPVPAISWRVSSRPVPPKMRILPSVPKIPTPPSYCHPCLFYGGDFDPTNSNANGLANEVTTLVSDATTYAPFTVPDGQTWQVSGLFTNNLTNVAPRTSTEAQWSISTGLSVGNPGTVLFSGSGPAQVIPTGRSGFGFTEYTVRVIALKGITLSPGRYWLSVVPICSSCNVAEYFESDSIEFLNTFGPQEPQGVSFFNSSYFGYDYANAQSVSFGMQSFSDGVLGLLAR